jgi:hypothetical protein
MSAARDGGTLPGLASTRVLGKPYTVTEYNHPAPLDSQAETVPMIAAFAAWQDWDGVFLFSYNHAGSFDRDRIHGFFDIDSNPSKMGFVGAGALIFSGERLAPAASQRTLSLGPDDRIRAARLNPTHIEPFLGESGYSMEALLGARWAISFDAGVPAGSGAASGPRPLRWQLDEGRERFLVDAPAVKAVCGRLKGPVELGGVTLDVTAPAEGSLILVSLTKEPVDRAERMLLVACGRSENTGMVWNEDRSSVGDRWGESPSTIEVFRGRISISGKPLKGAFALDGRGQRSMPAEVKEGGGAATIILGAGISGEGGGSLWYEISR